MCLQAGTSCCSHISFSFQPYFLFFSIIYGNFWLFATLPTAMAFALLELPPMSNSISSKKLLQQEVIPFFSKLVFCLCFYHDHQSDKSHHLLSVNYMPNIGLHLLHILFHLILTILLSRLYYLCFPIQKIEI